jgi:hypothetical protein
MWLLLFREDMDPSIIDSCGSFSYTVPVGLSSKLACLYTKHTYTIPVAQPRLWTSAPLILEHIIINVWTDNLRYVEPSY